MIMPQKSLSVEPVPVLSDNYVWMFESSPDRYVAVDPGESEPVIHWLAERGGRLSHILLTHHHADHIGGAERLRQQHGARLIGSHADRSRLPPLDEAVREGDILTLGEREIQVWETPGHTIGHVVYLAQEALFSGDTLFSLGCGRLFEGSPAMMWQNMKRIHALDDQTRLYCAHEYTLTNLGFALSLEPDDPELLALQAPLMEQNQLDQPTLPTTLAQERRFNPFLKTEEEAVMARWGLGKKSPMERFAFLREMRNRF